MQAKSKGQRKIVFEQFVQALDQVAAKKGVALTAVVTTIIAAGGPVDNGTKAEAVRLHDDKVCVCIRESMARHVEVHAKQENKIAKR
jgi:hypothetical protein